MVMIVEGPIRSSMYESVGTPTGAIERTETAESATDGPTRALGVSFNAEPYRSLLEDPEIAGWAKEWSERHNVTALDALGSLAQALLFDAQNAEVSDLGPASQCSGPGI
jgi:hypothetical protein